MARSLHVRLDEAADRDLRALEHGRGVSASVAVREAIGAAARRQRSRASLRAIAAELAADPADQAEAREVRALMDGLAPADAD